MMQQNTKSSAADCLYPSMRAESEAVTPQKPTDMEPHEYALRQMYPSMYDKEWLER